MNKLPLVIAVCGTIRSGTSCTAGVLSALGVPMGRSWIGPKPGNPKGFFEDRALRRITKQCFRNLKNPKPTVFYLQRIQWLREWARSRTKKDGPIIGGKDPFLCFMVHEMVEAFPRLRIIVPKREAALVAKSILNRKIWKMSLPACEKIIRDTVHWRNTDLAQAHAKVLQFPFTDLIQRPDTTINKIIDFCGIDPTPTQRAAALSFVDPNLCHFQNSQPSL